MHRENLGSSDPNPYDRAAVYTGLADVEAAFPELEAAYRSWSYWLLYLNVDPRMDRLRPDPRFVRLLRAMGLQSN